MAITTVLESHEKVMEHKFTDQVRGMDSLVTSSQLFRFMVRPTPRDVDAKVRLEVGGLWKSFGFPVINSCATADDLKTRMTEPPSVNREAALCCRNMFRKVFCRSFYSKHGRWPSVTLTEEVIPSIRHSVETNSWRETGAQGWSAADFEHVLLNKNLEYDYSVDTSDLLTDKAVNTGRDDLITNFDRHAYRVIHGKSAPRAKGRKTRVLTQFLCHNNLNVADILERIETGNVPYEWTAIVTVMKEKEGKIDNVRCFCKLTAEMRLYQTSTEKNIARSVFDYIRHQSMTMSEKELLETISTMTAPFGDASGKYGFISLDFSRWCLTMTLDSCLPIFIELDALFGLKRVFSFSQLFSYLCRTVVQDRFRPPRFSGDEPEDDRNSWVCSTRWMEGMRQKGWTLQTQATILGVAEERGTTATLLGQGDNQVIVVELPPSSVLSALGETSEFLQSFIRCLESYSEQLGMLLKPEETWTSTVLFEYSKAYHFKGSNVSSGLKRASRVSSYSNDRIKTFANRISSIYSSGASVAGVDTSPLMAYLLTLILVSDTIISEYTNIKDDELIGLLCVPACFGGLSVSLLSDFMYRGKLDDVSDSVGWLMYLAKNDPPVFRCVSRLVDLSPAPRRDLDLLVMNPFALNLDVPMTAENVIRRRVKEDLPSIVQTSEIQRLFSPESNDQRRVLIDDLLRIEPFNPGIAAHLYKLSNIALTDKIVGQYSSSRTVRQALERAEDTLISDTDFRSLILAMDSAQETHLRGKLTSNESQPIESLLLNPSSSCSMISTSELPNKLWNLQIEGVTMPCTLEQCVLTRWDSELIEPGRTITIDVDAGAELLTTRGQYKPYVGSLTQMRTRKSNLNVIDSSYMVTSLKKLTELLSWVVNDNSNLFSLIMSLCQEKTSVNIDDLKRVTRKVVGGSVQHRLADDSSSRGAMINGLYNFASHVRVCTDSAVDFAKQSTDYTLCFQAVILCCLSRLSMLYQLGNDVSGRWENSPYLEKRWTAAAANLASSQINLTGFDKSELTSTIIKDVEHKIRNYISPRMVAEQLYCAGRDGWPAISLALREQLKLVYSKAGMVAIETMHSYANRPKNAAIGITEVWSQALEFLKKYQEEKDEVESMYRGGWPFARSLAESVILPLASGNFPDLYYVSVKTAKRLGLLSNRQFQTSDKALTADKEELDRRIRLRITQVSEEGSEALRAAMRQLGVNMGELQEKEATLGRKRRHREDDDSIASSKDEEAQQSKRRR